MNNFYRLLSMTILQQTRKKFQGCTMESKYNHQIDDVNKNKHVFA